MKRPGHNNSQFFVGHEVERTPVWGQRTLFVIGVHSVQVIDAQLNDLQVTADNDLINHIYFGANHSFNPSNDSGAIAVWETMISFYLKLGYWCTLDFDIRFTEAIAESCLFEYNTFIPMISAKIPYIRLMNYNAVLKIDDRDFDATNPGVWCHSLHSLQTRESFTDWSQYSQDKVLR